MLTKAGCNSGACHGAAAGKNGFSLTLRGYDPDADYDALTREAAGRRVNKLEPAKSLVLLKPTETVPHMGGKRFEPESPEYRVIARWIAAGMPAPNTSDPKLLGLEVSPGRQTLAVGAQTKLKVIARYSNGAAEDVSRWARYATADENVAQVDQFGAVTIKGHGETAVNVGYLTGVSSVRIASPFPHEIPAEVYTRAERFNFIDDHVLAKLRDLHVAPSGIASDSAFIRRAWLDAAGVLPPAEEVERFLADTSPSAEKRAALVDRILRERGVGRLLVVQMVGPAAGVERQAGARQRAVVLPLDSRVGGREQAVGPLRLRDHDRDRAAAPKKARSTSSSSIAIRSISPRTSRRRSSA